MKQRIQEHISVVHYWAGCPKSPNSKWQSFLAVVHKCREQGWHNYLIWSKMPDNPALVEPFKKAGCEIVIQPRSRGNFDFASIWRNYKLLRRLKCDVFHCHNDHTSPLIAAALSRVPVRIWSKLAMSSYYENNATPKRLHLLMPSTRISCLCAHLILAISDKVRQELIETVGFGKKIYTVYVPVDFERFANASESSIRSELGFKSSHIIIAAVGHAVPVKGWDVAIKAFVQVHQRNPNSLLVFVGDITSQDFYNQLIHLIQEHKMRDKIIFLDKRDDIPEILKASDIFILPSRSEGLCLAMIEAMASGLPCIASNVGGIPEVITNELNGILFDRENSKQLAEIIIKLIEDKTLRKKLAFHATKRAQDFSMESYVEKIFNYYNNLLNKRIK